MKADKGAGEREKWGRGSNEKPRLKHGRIGTTSISDPITSTE